MYGSTVEQHFHYSSDLHDVAEQHHRHHDLEGKADQRELEALRSRVSDLEEAVDMQREAIDELRQETRDLRSTLALVPRGEASTD